MTTLSNHVPDPRLITAYAEHREGPLHRVNPWTKVGVVGALVLAVTVVDSLAALAGLYAATLAVYGVAGLPYRRLGYWYTLPLLFVVSVAGPLAVLEPLLPLPSSLPIPSAHPPPPLPAPPPFRPAALPSPTHLTVPLHSSQPPPSRPHRPPP